MEKNEKKQKDKEKKPKEKKNVFQQLEEQKEKLQKLKMKKDKEIKRVIFKSFEYLTEEDTFIRFSTLSKSVTFFEKIKNIILKEMEEEEIKINEEK